MDKIEVGRSVASTVCQWLDARGITAKEAAPLLGVATSTAYEYANGDSVPPGTKAPDIAARIGVDPDAFCRVAAADRRRLRRAHTKKSATEAKS